MKKGSFILDGSLIEFCVEDIEYHSTEFGVHCTGFGSLIIRDALLFRSLSEAEENLCANWLPPLMDELHCIARVQACEDRDLEVSRFADWRAFRNG